MYDCYCKHPGVAAGPAGLWLRAGPCGGGNPAAVDAALTTPAATQAVVPATGGVISKNPSSSSPIAISEDDALLVVTNSLDDTVSIINVASDANTKVAQVEVGDEPRTVANTPDKRYAYVTNQASATVSVIDPASNQKTQEISVGAEPYGIALTPDGKRAYVATSPPTRRLEPGRWIRLRMASTRTLLSLIPV